jgi:hypothetical protein
MFCPECGTEYRKGDVECTDCAVALIERLPEGFRPKRRSFSPRKLTSIDIAGKPLHCQHCGHEQFIEKWAKLHTSALSFMNASVDMYICGHCGFIHSFWRGVGAVRPHKE